MTAADETPVPDLNIGLERLCYIIVKARVRCKVEPMDQDPGSNPSDDGMRVVLEDYSDDPTLAELMGAIQSLDEDEVIEVTALVWLGRGDFSREEWADALELARSDTTRVPPNTSWAFQIWATALKMDCHSLAFRSKTTRSAGFEITGAE